MVNVQKKLQGTKNVLAAFTTENGMAIGSKISGEHIVEAVVIIKGNEDGTSTLYINEDKLKELKCKVVYKNFADKMEE